MNKRIVAVNALPFGSTGRIMQGIAHEAAEGGYSVDMFVGTRAKGAFDDSRVFDISTPLGNRASINLSKLTGREGRFARLATGKLIKRIDAIDPVLLHIHILHHSYLNIPMLFRYIKEKNIPVVWTMHDCWAFTGHCPHFAFEKCDKWKNGCYSCPRYKAYPRSLFDNSKAMWRLKKKWFSGVENLTIVTPSDWLKGLLEESFLKDYPAVTIHNGIDLDTFKPTESDIREKYAVKGEEKLILGVSSVWNNRKGLDVFIELARRLPADYRIMLVGGDEDTHKLLPENIISVYRTEDQHRLAKIYSAADVFVNPTREDTFPTVNLEALACGTPVITFNTGGSGESIDESCGRVVPCGDIDSLEKAVKEAAERRSFGKEACRKRAEGFDSKKQFEKYLEIYKTIAK